jgi:hypothetical protein
VVNVQTQAAADGFRPSTLIFVDTVDVAGEKKVVEFS